MGVCVCVCVCVCVSGGAVMLWSLMCFVCMHFNGDLSLLLVQGTGSDMCFIAC